MKRLMLILVSVLIIISGCSKPPKPAPVPVSPDDPGKETPRTFVNGEWDLVKSFYKDNEYNAVNYFVSLSGAVADGVYDDSYAIQAALDKAASAGGGNVYIPKGKYRVSRPVNIPDNVSLIGDFVSPTSKKGSSEGTVIIVEGSDMLRDASLFILHDNSSISDLTVWYEEQSFEELSKYAYTIRHAAGKSASVRNIAMLNTYNGITADASDCEDFLVENVYMTAFNNALRVKNCSGKLTVRGLSVSPVYWINDEMTSKPDDFDISHLNDEIYSNLTAVSLLCSGDASLTDITVDTARTALFMSMAESEDKSPLVSLLNVSNTFNPVYIDRVPRAGAAFSLCTFGTSNLLDSVAVRIASGFDSTLSFNSCTFPGQPSYSVRSEGLGRISFVNCKFVGWRNAALHLSDIIFTAVNTSFNAGTSPASVSDKTVGMFAQCSLSAEPDDGTSHLFVINTENEYEFDVLDKSHIGSSASAPEIKDAIFYAKDHGLSVASEDNYNAIQSAINYAYMNGGGTVFIPAGQYRIGRELVLKEGVRLMGAGSGTNPTISTVLFIDKNAGDDVRLVTLESSTVLCGLTFYYYNMPDLITAETPPAGIAVYAENRKDIVVSDVSFVRPSYGIVFKGCDSVTLEKIEGTTIVNGIRLESSSDIYAEDINLTAKYATSDELVSYRQSNYSGVYVSGGEDIVFRNISCETADYAVDLASEEVLLVPAYPYFTALNVFSRDVYATAAVSRYPYASFINVASRPTVFSTNAYHVTTFHGNRGKVNVYNLLGSGNVTGGVYVRSGTVSVQSSVFNSLGKTAVSTDGANISLIGSMLLDNDCTYHVEASLGGAFLLGNITNNLSTAFEGIEAKYVRKYIDTEASYADDGNMRGILPE